MKTFCIGLFKTGTTSYSKAMGLLGKRDLHFPPRYIAAFNEVGRPFQWDRVKWDSISNMHEVEYRELMRLYPGARFVLTTRNVDKWLPSIRAHMDRPWSSELHVLFDARFQKVFGVPCRLDAFDDALFRKVFREHDEKVRDDCPNLLVLDLDGGTDLMESLSKHVGGGVKYPHANRRRSRKPGEPVTISIGRKYEEVA